jgi:MFS family permease
VSAGAGYLALMTFALFGAFLALVAPVGFALSIAVARLVPAHPEYLRGIVGAGSIAAVLSAVLVGRLSDRVVGRLGRRRPFLIAGAVIGTAALVVAARAATILQLGISWAIAQIGWGAVIAMLTASQADRLARNQRGKAAGLSTVAFLLAPLFGMLISQKMIADQLRMFVVPGVVGAIGVATFVCLIREPRRNPATVDLETPKAWSMRSDFEWNLIAKVLLLVALTIETSYVSYLLADRVDAGMRQMTDAVEAVAIGCALAGILGALAAGFLSDRLQQRRIPAVAGAVIFAVATGLMAVAPNVLLVEIGAVVGSFGIGLFLSMSLAIMLDVLPDRGTDAGRYSGLYAAAIPFALGMAPLIAPILITSDAGYAGQSYTLLYIAAAVLAVVAGVMVWTRVKTVR